MTDDYGVSVRQWTDVLRRAQLSRTTKAIGFLLSMYADSDGTRVFPGIARVAVESGMTYNTAKKAMAELRAVGMLELVRSATRRGDSDEYRLTLGPELMERVEVLSPGQVSTAIEQMRNQRRGKYQPDGPEPPDLRPTRRAAETADLQPTERAAQEEPAAHVLHSNNGPAAHFTSSCGPRRDPPPTTTGSQELPTTLMADLDLKPAVPGARASPPKTNPSSSKCSHGLSAARRDDGTAACAICRREETRAA